MAFRVMLRAKIRPGMEERFEQAWLVIGRGRYRPTPPTWGSDSAKVPSTSDG